jgi:hypothetical protein
VTAMIDHTPAPPPTRRWVPAVVALTSLLVVSLLVLSTSRAAFTGDTTTTGNSWTTGSVDLSDDQPTGTAMFTIDPMVPGDVVTNSITVTNESTVDSVDVRLYGEGLVRGTSLTDPGVELAEHLDLTITVAGGPVFAGTLAEFAANRTDFTTGADDWDDVVPQAQRTYDFVVTFVDGPGVDALENVTAEIDFVWEATSNATRTP